MSIFETYEREFSGLMADITRKSNAVPEQSGGKFCGSLCPVRVPES